MENKFLNELIKVHEQLVSILVDIAEDPHTDSETLRLLSNLSDDWVKTCVSLHPNTPSKILRSMLLKHSAEAGEDEQWRIQIVGNPALDLKLLEKIMKKDPSKDVRRVAETAFRKRRKLD